MRDCESSGQKQNQISRPKHFTLCKTDIRFRTHGIQRQNIYLLIFLVDRCMKPRMMICKQWRLSVHLKLLLPLLIYTFSSSQQPPTCTSSTPPSTTTTTSTTTSLPQLLISHQRSEAPFPLPSSLLPPSSFSATLVFLVHFFMQLVSAFAQCTHSHYMCIVPRPL